MSRIAVVTGASSGIGLAAVAALAGDGWQVVATARNPERSEQLRQLTDGDSPAVTLKALDVTDDASVAACVEAVAAEHGAIDLLLNNAGGGYRGTLEQLSLDDLAKSLDLNFFGVARVTKAVLPLMRSAGSGRIITVTSMNGVLAMPFSDAYNAGKFAVEGLMEGLAPVLRQFGVYVSILEPGPVRTAFLANLGGHAQGAAADDPYRELLDRYNARMAALGAGGQSPESVAEVICRIASDPDPALRYQSSDAARVLAGRKLVDPTGTSILAGTAMMFGDGPITLPPV